MRLPAGLIDQHLHSHNSFDSKTAPIHNVERAIERGLSGLTFTEHFDTHPSEWDDCVYDDRKIATEILELRKRFGDKIFIGKGIEVCWQPQRMEFILDFLAHHRFDLVIVSVHWAHNKPVHQRHHFDDWSVEKYLRNYLEAVRDAVEEINRMKSRGRQPFHILGHMDFARRYAKSMFNFDGPLTDTDLIDEILTLCLDAELIPEVNTSTLRNQMNAPMPGPEVMHRYAELGGTMMSLGSDAHTPEHIGASFEEAIVMLKSAGISRFARFQEGFVDSVAL